MKKQLRLVYITCLIFFIAGCKKDDVEQLPLPDENGYIWLRDVKSLSLIKKTIQGSWKIHYAYGGLTGHQKVELTNSWFRYLPNDSMYIVFEGELYAATKPNFLRKRTEFGYDAWVLDFEFINAWQLRDELVIDLITQDSLWLVQNNVDPIGYIMTKQLTP